MGQQSASLPSWRRVAEPWRRSMRRRWIRPNDPASVMRMLGMLPSLPRHQLARLTMIMIDRMDEIDGDPDLEHLREDDEDTHDREQEQAYE